MKYKREIISPIEFDDSIRKKSVEFSVPGKPRGKERPRMARRGRFVTTYTPQKTVDYENLTRKSYIKENGNFMLSNAIEADVLAIFPIPKSASKKKKELMLSNQIKCTVKPDCDNIDKSIFDALNNVAYHDDSQICKTSTEKRYGENPRVIVKLREI